MTHDTTRPLLSSKVHKRLEREEQQVIRCHDQHIIIDLELLHGEQQVAHSPQPRLIRLRPIIHDGDRLRVVLLRSPRLKNPRKLMVRNDDMLINLRNPVDIIQHPPEDGIVPDLQQRLREVLRQLPQPRRIPRCNHNILHTNTILTAKVRLSEQKTKFI